MDKNSAEYNDFLIYARNEHNCGASWASLCKEYYDKFKEFITIEALRKRVKRHYNNNSNKLTFMTNAEAEKTRIKLVEYEQFNSDGSIEATTKRIIENIAEFRGNKTKMLNYLGYNEKEWELTSWRVSQWDGGKENKELYAIQYKIKPKTGVTEQQLLTTALSSFSKDIKPLDLPKIKKDCSRKPKMMEIPPIELHLGKIADKIQTGEEYSLQIAKDIFNNIFRNVGEIQDFENCDECLMVIGSDFFNSENDNCTSIHKIPQQNCHGYIKLFAEAIEMYVSAILFLREHFNKVSIMLCAGNHARAMETFLYMALEQRFVGDNIVNFLHNYQTTQFYKYGDNVIFFNHGDVDIKRVIKSIPAEFPSQWGSAVYRELHLGHLHKEMVVDDDGGMITRRIGSLCGTDIWHKDNRYVGATKQHQIFVWSKFEGLKSINYIHYTHLD